jgi:hypothetical protein
MKDDEEDDQKAAEIRRVFEEAKHPRKRYQPDAIEKEQENDVRKWLKKGDRVRFMEALRRAGIKDGTERFLKAVEAFDRHHKR